jgi:PKD repeat protein
MKKQLLFFSLLAFQAQAQTIVWSDDFENAANWTLNQSTGQNDADANQWYINDNEGGVAAGGCGTASNGNKTLHIGCQGSFCLGTGAIYNAGDGGLGFIYATTNKRAVFTGNISTAGQSNLTLSFDYIGIGQANADFATAIYSIDGGSTWQNLQVVTSGTTCGNGQGQWQATNIPLPASCNNIATLRIGFNWTNNNDGTGTDPSFAVNNIRVTTPSLPTPPTSVFNLNANSICQGECISFSNQSTGTSTSWLWNFGDGTTSTLQNPPLHCYSTSGNLTVSLTVTNAAGSNTSTQSLTVSSAPNAAVQNIGGTLTAQQPNALYQWVLCPSNAVIPGATAATYTPTLNGQYAVIVTTTNGCSDTSACTTISGLSIDELGTTDLLIVPTVFNESFSVKGIVNEMVSLAMFSLDGEEVYSVPNYLEGQELSPQIGAGVYLIKIRLGDRIMSKRVVKL